MKREDSEKQIGESLEYNSEGEPVDKTIMFDESLSLKHVFPLHIHALVNCHALPQ